CCRETRERKNGQNASELATDLPHGTPLRAVTLTQSQQRDTPLLWMLLAADGTALTPPPQAEIVVTGSRVATDPADLAANVTVLTREDFDVEKPTQLADILRRVAGVHVDQVGGRGGTGSLYLR